MKKTNKAYHKASNSFGAVRLGFVGTTILVLCLPLIFVVATIGSALTMLFGKKQ
tara:strand:- start:417 stop:578 length:162 start_codon:yes stop_codon:yes gene_type:complete